MFVFFARFFINVLYFVSINKSKLLYKVVFNNVNPPLPPAKLVAQHILFRRN